LSLNIQFDSLTATYAVGDEAYSDMYETVVRRLSTCSYVEDSELVGAGGGATQRFLTQWRWFYNVDGNWFQFGEVSFTSLRSLSERQRHITLIQRHKPHL